MADNKVKPKKQITGPTIDVEGNFVAEDGEEVTPAIEAIYKFKEEQKESRALKVYKDRTPVKGTFKGPKPVLADVLDIPKVCENCYLQDKCPHYDEAATCAFRTQVRLEEPTDMIELLRMMIEMQGERIIFGRFIEQMEGGYVDRNLSDEMRRLMEMLKDFKELLSDKEEISIRVKGKEAVKQAGGGVLSQIFGGGGGQKPQ